MFRWEYRSLRGVETLGWWDTRTGFLEKAMSKNVLEGNERIDTRDRRALTEYMTLLLEHGMAKGAPDLYAGVGQNGNGASLVDMGTNVCTCGDVEYNLSAGETCKHRKRVALATGERIIPKWIDVNPNLGEHTNSTYTYHREALEAGRSRYVRCETCGDESLPADPERVLLDNGWPEAG